MGVVISGVVQVLGRGRIATCGHGAGNMQEGEREVECSKVDHCEALGCRRSLGLGKSGENPDDRQAHPFMQKLGPVFAKPYLCAPKLAKINFGGQATGTTE
jgi:hypothetical protein